MPYLVTELVSLLLLAAILGFVTGFALSRWLARTNKAELMENWRAKVLNATRKVDILRWELKAEAAKASAAEESQNQAIAELRAALVEKAAAVEEFENQLRAWQEGRLRLPLKPDDSAVVKLSLRIAELEQTLSGGNNLE